MASLRHLAATLGLAAALLGLPGEALAKGDGTGTSTDLCDAGRNAGCSDSSEDSSAASSEGSSNSFGGADAEHLVGLSAANPMTARIALGVAAEAGTEQDRAQRLVSSYLLINQDRVARHALISGLSSEQIEALELDVADGSGPGLDALAQGFNLTTDETRAVVRAVRSSHPSYTDDDRFSEALVAALAVEGSLSGEVSRQTIDDLYTQQATCGCSGGYIVQSLALASGVPEASVAAVTAAVLDSHLTDAARAGEVRSARELLAEDADAILSEIIRQLVTANEDIVLTRIEVLTQSPASPTG